MAASSSCVIKTSPSVDKSIVNEVKKILPRAMEIKQETYLRASGSIPSEAIILVFLFVGKSVAEGFLEELGEDTYAKLKGVFTKMFVKEGKKRVITLQFKSKNTNLSFECETDSEDIIRSALENIPPVVSAANAPMSLYFNKSKRKWEE